MTVLLASGEVEAGGDAVGVVLDLTQGEDFGGGLLLLHGGEHVEEGPGIEETAEGWQIHTSNWWKYLDPAS
jgi:hypothetical protein